MEIKIIPKRRFRQYRKRVPQNISNHLKSRWKSQMSPDQAEYEYRQHECRHQDIHPVALAYESEN